MEEQSYDPVLPMKVGNRRASERSGHGIRWREGGNRCTYLAKGNIAEAQTLTTMSTQIDRISELAKEDPKRQFFSIAHLITPEALYAAFRGLRKKASAGVDGVTYEKYEKDAARKIQQLHERLREGKYRAQPLRRIYIPQGKWEGATYLHTIFGGQDRAESDG
jgi:hypothetical protein